MFFFRFLVEEPDPDSMQFDENWCSNDDSLYPSGLAQVFVKVISIVP